MILNFRWTGKEDCIPLEDYVPEWIALGTKIVGGCCRTYARDISRIKNAIKSSCCPCGDESTCKKKREKI